MGWQSIGKWPFQMKINQAAVGGPRLSAGKCFRWSIEQTAGCFRRGKAVCASGNAEFQ